jgi:hypothetical protein
VAERIKATNLALTRAVGSGDIFIIASQDCDICCDSYEEEPMFEVVLARHLPDDSEDGNLFSGKNPRRLQMRIERHGTESLYELNINERRPAPRLFLAEAQDQPSGSLPAPDLEVFRRWLGRRYYRSSLPTEFNERCRPAQIFLAEKLKKQGKLIEKIFLKLDPRCEELHGSQKYRVSVHLTVLPETVSSPEDLKQALAAQSLFEKAFARCDPDGIELLGVHVVSEADFSLHDVRECVRWDYSDYISYRASPAKNIVPEGEV